MNVKSSALTRYLPVINGGSDTLTVIIGPCVQRIDTVVYQANCALHG